MILSKLKEIELENDISILYACESGSRAWGFDNCESDYDIRFIYKANSLRNYLSLSRKSDVFEVMDGDLDIVGWDIRKALLLHFKSNPNLREWIVSPIKYIDWKMDIFKNLPDFNSDVLKYHYLHIALNNWKKLSKLNSNPTNRDIKMYLYNSRCILAYKLLLEGKNPSINIFDLLSDVDLNKSISNDLHDLISYYKGNCKGNIDLKSIHNWMGDNLEVMNKKFPKKSDKRDFNLYDERFYEILKSDFPKN